MAAPERRAAAWPHILILLAFCALFFWLFSRFFLRPLYLAESDLYENGLPIFLSPVWIWSSFEFSGLPVLADPANFTFYPPNMLFGELLHSWTAVVMSAPLLAACFTYAYVFSLTRSRTAAIFSALAYSLSEDMLERLRHLNHVHAIAWLPLILLSIDRVRGNRPRLWIVIGAAAVGSCILAGHPQPALYAMYCAGLYALAGLIVDPMSQRTRPPVPGAPAARPRWQQFSSTAAMFAVGILLASVKALPLAESSSLVVRSEGLTFTRFVGPSLTGPQMFSFVFPTIEHAPTTELPTYVGAGHVHPSGRRGLLRAPVLVVSKSLAPHVPVRVRQQRSCWIRAGRAAGAAGDTRPDPSRRRYSRVRDGARRRSNRGDPIVVST